MHYSRFQLSKIVSKFEKIWNEPEKNSEDYIEGPYLYYENFSRENALMMGLGKMVFAKGVQSKNRCHIVAIVNNMDKGYSQLCRTMGIDMKVFKEIMDNKIRFMAKIRTIIVFMFQNRGEKIARLKYKNVLIGDLVYNTIIRELNRNKYTVDKLEGKAEFEVLEKAYMYAYTFDKIFRKCPPKYYIVDESGYTDAVIARVAAKHNAQIIQYMSNYLCSTVNHFNEGYQFGNHSIWREKINLLLENDIEGGYEEEADRYLESIFKGKGNLSINEKTAYVNKKVIDKEQLLQELKINNENKNILVLAHCFSDCPLCGGQFVYVDYYQWFVETMKIISELKNVNWIIRPHPMRHNYSENGVIENIFQRYKTDNMYWMGDEYSSEMVPVVADAIITVNGTAGVEYSCCGIPSIVVGNPFYTGYGYTINVKSRTQYREILEKAHLIHKLTETQINNAKKILYLYKTRVFCTSDDEFQQMSNRAINFYYETHDVYEANSRYLQEVNEWMEHHDIKKSYLYQFGLAMM